MFRDSIRIMRTFFAALVFLLLAACSTSEFESAPSKGKGQSLSAGEADKKGEKDSGADGQDGEDASSEDQNANGSGEDEDEAADDDEDSDSSGKDGSSGCRFMEDESLAEEIKDGPGLKINPNDYKAKWSKEGKDIHFPLVAYKVPGEQTVQMHADDIADVLHSAGASDMAALPDMHFKLPSNHWQLEPISIYDLHGITAPKIAGFTPPHFDVKYEYSVVLSNANSKKCKMTAALTEEPFLDRTGGGCFGLSTLIKMADGQEKMIALLNVGDEVLNPATGKAARIVEITSGPEADKQMIEIGFGRHSLRVTEGHPVPTRVGLKQAKHLTKADQIQGADGSFHALAKLERLPLDKTQMVRNLVINPTSDDPADHMLLAGGVVTGDLFLQRRLAAGEAATPGLLSRMGEFLTNLLAL